MPHPGYQPSEPPPPGVVLAGQDERDATAELLTLTWEFFTRASPAVRDELRSFLTSRGCHPATGWFPGSVQFSASSLTRSPSEGLPDSI